jgi:hypothetical protein
MPLLEGEPEAAFFLRPEAPKTRSQAAAKTRGTRGKRAGAAGKRRSPDGEPAR